MEECKRAVRTCASSNLYILLEVEKTVLKITWDDKICTHSGNCVRSLPSVFQVKDGKFVIVPTGAPEDQVRKTVNACPSGALKILE